MPRIAARLGEPGWLLDRVHVPGFVGNGSAAATLRGSMRALLRPGRDDLRALLRLAGPLVTVQVGGMAMGVVDTIMVGRVSGEAMAAAALGSLYSFGVMGAAMGTLFALDPLLSQAVGAADEPGAARTLQRGFVLAGALSIAVALLHLPAEALFRAVGQPPEVVPVAAGYVRASIPGIAPFLVAVALRQALQARHRIRPLIVTTVAANVVNAALNWAFIYGHLGLPAMGAVGSAWSTSLSRWFLVAFMAAAGWRDVGPMLVPWRRGAFDVAALRRILVLGVPMGAQFAAEMGAFNMAGLLIGRIGAVELAGHQVALNLSSLAFMVPLGVSIAASVLVGNAIGRADMPAARRAAGAGLLCGVGFMAASAVVFLLLPWVLAGVYSNDGPVVAMAAALIPIAGVFQVFDGAQVVATGVLRGLGESRVPAAANLAGYWLVGLPVGWWLTARGGMGPSGLWWGLCGALAVVSALLLWRTTHVLRGDVRRLEADAAPAA